MLPQIQQFLTANVPLISYSRGGILEAVHRGSFSIITSSGHVLYEQGRTDIPVTLRSCNKPFQLFSVLQTGADEKFGFSEEELALAAASHAGQKIHIDAALSMLRKMDLSESALRCGIHPPFEVETAKELAEAGIDPSPASNNCSGKHAAMLAACLAKGWDTTRYEDVEHPLQKLNMKNTVLFADTEDELPVAIDGCTVPTFAVPLRNGALAYARIADPSQMSSEHEHLATRIFRIMNNHPEFVAGPRRLETWLMSDFPGKLIAKVGAEACYAIGLAPGVLHEEGVGIALKMEDGISFNRSVDAVIVGILYKLGLIDESMRKKYEKFLPSFVKDHRGREVGKVELLFDL